MLSWKKAEGAAINAKARSHAPHPSPSQCLCQCPCPCPSLPRSPSQSPSQHQMTDPARDSPQTPDTRAPDSAPTSATPGPTTDSTCADCACGPIAPLARAAAPRRCRRRMWAGPCVPGRRMRRRSRRHRVGAQRRGGLVVVVGDR